MDFEGGAIQYAYLWCEWSRLELLDRVYFSLFVQVIAWILTVTSSFGSFLDRRNGYGCFICIRYLLTNRFFKQQILFIRQRCNSFTKKGLNNFQGHGASMQIKGNYLYNHSFASIPQFPRLVICSNLTGCER